MPRPQNRLNDRTLRHLTADPARAYDLADGGDLYVRVEPSGSKVFWLRYQLDGRRWVLGHYGETGVSLAEVREKRDDAKKLLRQGLDPFEQDQGQKQAQKRALEAAKRAELKATRREAWTVAWLIEQFCEHELPVIHKKPGWGKVLLRKHVGARLGPLPLGELSSAKIWECLDPLRAGQPATARHVYGLICKVTAVT
jgi:hypothetical protein